MPDLQDKVAAEICKKRIEQRNDPAFRPCGADEVCGECGAQAGAAINQIITSLYLADKPDAADAIRDECLKASDLDTGETDK